MNDKLATVWWALKQELPVKPKMVLIMLANYMSDEKGYAWPTYRELSRLCGMPESTCRKHVQWLVDRGLLVKEAHFYGGRQRSNRYYMPVNVMAFQGAHNEQAGCSQLAGEGAHNEQPKDTPITDTIKDKPNSVAVPTTGTGESNMKQKDGQTVLGVMDTGHKSFGPKTKDEIFAKLKYYNGQLTAKSCGLLWSNSIAHASDEKYGHEPEVTHREQGRLLLAQKRCGADFAEVMWFVMTDWLAFTTWAEKNSDAFDSPLRPSLGYFQKWAHIAGEYYNEMGKTKTSTKKKVAVPTPKGLTKPNVKVQTKGKMTPEEWAELQKEITDE